MAGTYRADQHQYVILAIWIGLNWLVFLSISVWQLPPDVILGSLGLSASSKPYAVLSYGLIHFRVEHLLANTVVALTSVWLGSNVYSWRATASLLFFGTVAGGVAHLWFSEAQELYLHGSSAASSALLGAGAINWPTRSRLVRAALPAMVYLGVWSGTGDSASWAAHNGGLLAGFALGIFIRFTTKR